MNTENTKNAADSKPNKKGPSIAEYSKKLRGGKEKVVNQSKTYFVIIV